MFDILHCEGFIAIPLLPLGWVMACLDQGTSIVSRESSTLLLRLPGGPLATRVEDDWRVLCIGAVCCQDAVMAILRDSAAANFIRMLVPCFIIRKSIRLWISVP